MTKNVFRLKGNQISGRKLEALRIISQRSSDARRSSSSFVGSPQPSGSEVNDGVNLPREKIPQPSGLAVTGVNLPHEQIPQPSGLAVTGVNLPHEQIPQPSG